MFNPRAILGLEENANAQRIKQAYREKSALHHPDKGGNAEMMKLINRARDELLQQAEDTDFIENSIEVVDEILRTKIPEHFDTSEDRISVKYRALHSSLEQQFADQAVEEKLGYSCFKKFETNLYYDVTLDNGELIIIDYQDLFDLVTKKKFITDCDELEVLSKPLTPETAIEIFIQFIEGKCFGNNLTKAKDLISSSMQTITSVHPAYSLFQGILKVFNIEGFNLEQEHHLLWGLNYITNFIRQNPLQNMPYSAKLLQNIYFRNLFSQALHWYWEGGGNLDLTFNDLFNCQNLKMTKSYLGTLAKQVLANAKSQEEDLDLLKTTAYIKKLYEFEGLIDEANYKQQTVASCRELGFAILDWLTVLIPYANRKIIVNILLQAGMCFQLSSFGKKTIPSRKKANEKLALHAYMEAIGVASRSSPDLEIYALTNCLRFIAGFHYQDYDLKELISALQTRILLLVDLFPVYIPMQSNIDLLRNQEQTLGVMRSFLHTLVAIIEKNKSLETPIHIEHEYVKVLYQAYEACIKAWYQEHYDPELENKFRLELMDLLLWNNNWAFTDLSEYLTLRASIQRDQAGWMCLAKPLRGLKEVKTFFSLEGMEINSQTGEIKFTCSENEGLKGGYPTINFNDITEMLVKNIMGGSFSLDPVDPQMPYHPFNAMRFVPKDLYQTQFLNTMLLSDYVLKFLTIGQEVQGIFPYDLRSIQDAIKHLPRHLRKIIDDFQKESQVKIGSIHRFWIEAEQLNEAHLEEENGICKIAISDIKMVLKKHTMERDFRGNLVDTEKDHEGWDLYLLTSSEWANVYDGHTIINGSAMLFVLGIQKVSFVKNSKIYKQGSLSIYDFDDLKKLASGPREKNGKIIVTIDNSMLIYKLIKTLASKNNEPTNFSPEYVFAQEFTLHYDEFANHIEIFKRLRELSKITVAVRILNIKKVEVTQKSINLELLLSSLPSWEERDLNTHPTNQSNYFDLPLPDLEISSKERDFAIFRHHNSKFIKNILPKHLYKLRGGNENLAKQDFATAKAQIKQMILASKPLLDKFEEIGLGYSVREEELDLEKQCLWVPASVRHHVAENSSQFVYGGVRVLPRVNSIERTNQNFSRMMGNAFATQNRVTVNATAVGKTAMIAQQTSMNSVVRYSTYQSAPEPTRAQAASANFTSARSANTSYQSASALPRQQPVSSDFRDSTGSYQQASSSHGGGYGGRGGSYMDSEIFGKSGGQPSSGSSGGNSGDSSGSNKKIYLTQVIQQHLGKDFKMIRNKSGDAIFVNADNTKKIRFDINNHLHGNVPHAHVEHKDENDDWVDSTNQHRIYFKDSLDYLNKPRNEHNSRNELNLGQ